jgi:hypothetical protein
MNSGKYMFSWPMRLNMSSSARWMFFFIEKAYWVMYMVLRTGV